MEEREPLREMRIENLRAQLREGIDSGPGIPADDIFDRLQEKYGDSTPSR